MKYLRLLLGASLIVMLAGCASLAGVFGIASETYVDEQVAAARSQTDSELRKVSEGVEANRGAIETNKATIDEYTQTAGELEELIVSIQQTVETTDELKELASVLEQRLENLPVETIRQLVGILQSYLEDK